MNPIYSAASDGIQGGTLMGLMTAFFLAVFVFWTWWAFRPAAAERLSAAAAMPLDDGELP